MESVRRPIVAAYGGAVTPYSFLEIVAASILIRKRHRPGGITAAKTHLGKESSMCGADAPIINHRNPIAISTSPKVNQNQSSASEPIDGCLGLGCLDNVAGADESFNKRRKT